MSVVRIATNFNIDLEFISAPFYKRLLAWVIDLIIQIIYLILANQFFTWMMEHSNYDDNTMANIWAWRWLLRLPFFLYHLVCEITMNGQSFGKKIMGLRVISETGGRPNISQFIIRWLIRTSDYTLLMMIIIIPYAQLYGSGIYWAVAGAMILLAVDIILVNTRKEQRLGDILAHTLLISTTQKEAISDTIFLDVSDKYVPSFPEVMQLSDRDINSLKGILDTARRRHDYNLAEMASEKIKNHLKIDTTLSPFDFLEVLLKDYNYLSAN
jgi:uncharacterized RDD family membrane protein YckC